MKKRFDLNNNKYDLLFLALLILTLGAIIFKEYLFLNKLYIYNDVGADTLNSYWAYLHYIASQLQEDQLPLWSHNIGLGTSIFSVGTLIFDPFNILLFLVAEDNLVFLLPYVALLKILVAGILFYKYLKMFRFTRFSIILGSLVYAFNGYLILWGQHHTFGTFVALLPLVLWGFEKWFQQNKISLFVFSIAILTAHNIYLFYMFSIFLVIYVIFRIWLLEEKQIPRITGFLTKTISFYIIGVGISGILLLPTVYTLLTSPRVNGSLLSSNIFGLDEPRAYISTFFRFISNDMLKDETGFYGWNNYYEDPMLYAGLITLIVIPYLFFIQKIKEIKIHGAFLAIFVVFLTFPFFTYMLNAFSSNQRRWTFIVIIAMCYLLAYVINYIDKNKLDSYKPFRTIILSIFALGTFFTYLGYITGWTEDNVIVTLERLIKVVILLSIYSLLLFLLKYPKQKPYIKVVILIIVSIELCIQSSAAVNNRSNLPVEFLQNKEGYFDYTIDAIDFLEQKDTGFYRVDKDYISVFYADSVFQEYKGFTAYNSLNTPAYTNFLRALEVPFKVGDHNNYITGLENRLMLKTLLGSKYYLSKAQEGQPFGYDLIEKKGDIYIYENQYYLPLAVTYDNYLDGNTFKNLPSYLKEFTLLNTVVIKNNDINKINGLNEYNETNPYKKIEMNKKFNTVNADITSQVDGKIKLTALNNDPQLIFNLKKPISSESVNTILTFKLESKSQQKGQIFWKVDGTDYSEKQSLSFQISPSVLEYTINLGNISADEIRIDFAEYPGNYALSNFEIKVLPTEVYVNSIRELSEYTLNIEEYNNTLVQGSIDVPSERLLVFSIPFDKGWSLKINGENRELIETNYGFLGVLVDKGLQEIELTYSPPFLKMGLIISILSLAIFLIICVRRKK